MDKVRFGVVGTNFISDWVIAGARQDERFELVAVYSRTQETADAFASKHNIPYTFTSLEEMAKSPLIDAVYIASPNFLHASQSILCMSYGKHVLCEKPFASNAKEVRAMIEASRTYNDGGDEAYAYAELSCRARESWACRYGSSLFRLLLPVFLPL